MNTNQEIKKGPYDEELGQITRIITLLNEFGKIKVEDYIPLEINEDSLDSSIILAKKRVEFIRKKIEFNNGNNDQGIFLSYAFRALFIGTYDFKTDNLDQRIKYFEAILKTFDTEEVDPIAMKLQEELKKNLRDKELYLFKEYFLDFILSLSYFILRANEPIQSEINEFIIKAVEGIFVTNIHFKYDDLKDIPHELLMDDLYQILAIDNLDNDFHLYIDNGRLKAVPYTINELVNYINSPDLTEIKANSKDDTKKKGPKKKNKKRQKKDKKEIKKEDKKEIKKEDKKEIKKEDKKEIKKGDKKEEQNEDINQEKQNEDIIIEEEKDSNCVMDEIKKLKEKLEDLEEENEELKRKIDDLKQGNEELKKEVEDLLKYKEKSEKMMEQKDKKMEKLSSIINSLMNDNNQFGQEIILLKSDIKLIKLRRAFKMFVNYIYIGLNLKGDNYYEYKISRIIDFLTKLKKSINYEYNGKLIESSQILLNKLSGKIDLGNFVAHHVDTNLSIIDQIFAYVDHKKKHEDFRLKLKNGTNVDKVVKDLLINTEKNLHDYNTLKKEEEKIIKTIPLLKQIWMGNDEN